MLYRTGGMVNTLQINVCLMTKDVTNNNRQVDAGLGRGATPLFHDIVKALYSVSILFFHLNTWGGKSSIAFSYGPVHLSCVQYFLY